MNIEKKTKTRIRNGDTVKVIAGNSRGQIGKVFRCDGERILVQGINKAKKHVKKTNNAPGQIVERERPIHKSNLRVCINEDKPVKLKVRVGSNGQRELVYKEEQTWNTYRVLSKSKE